MNLRRGVCSQPTPLVPIRLLCLPTALCCPIPASVRVLTACLFLPRTSIFSSLTSKFFCPPGHLIVLVWSSVEWPHGTIRESWVVILALVTPTSLGFVFLLLIMWEWP